MVSGSVLVGDESEVVRILPRPMDIVRNETFAAYRSCDGGTTRQLCTLQALGIYEIVPWTRLISEHRPVRRDVFDASKLVTSLVIVKNTGVLQIGCEPQHVA